MSMIYDNWERLVAAVLKREQIWQLCHQNSRSSSISSGYSSDLSNASFRSSDVNLHDTEESVNKPVSRLVFLGGNNPSFRLIGTLKSDRELGKGRFATTMLSHLLHDVQVSDKEVIAKGTKVVVKLLNEVKSTREEFTRQMMGFGNCRHENVSGNESRPNWESRLKIAIGAARGIAHIHTLLGAHGNIKSSNIFLNSKQYGTVSDFDLSCIMVETPNQGALGYHAPAYYLATGSQESDVYCFGNMLLELLTGKSPMEAQGFEKDLYLGVWARSIKSEDRSRKLFDQTLRRPIRYETDVLEMMRTEVPSVYDSVVKDSVTNLKSLRAILGSHFQSMARVPANYFAAGDLIEMTEMFEVAMRCLDVVLKDMPKMSGVVLMLENIGKPKQDRNSDSPGDKERIRSRIFRLRR